MKNIPVLAFSENSTFGYTDFEQLPVGMKEWVSETILLNYEIGNDTVLQKANDVMFEWQSNLPKLKSTKIIDPDECYYTYFGHSQDIYDDCILETHWSQKLPYKLKTSICQHGEYAGEHQPTGCVATSMAQIMNFWEHPNGYDWDILLNKYPDYSTTSAYAVAGLMKDIGSEVHMNYGCGSSGALHYFAKNAFKNDFGYSSSITHDDYHIDDITNNIKWGYPVVLGGFRTRLQFLNTYWYKNGHSWVCDGLREEYDRYKRTCYTGAGIPMVTYFTKNYRYYLHMNWGWGNTKGEDTWYFSNNLTQPDDGRELNYRWKKDMIINIHP